MTLSQTNAPVSPSLTMVEKLRGLPWSIAANVANTVYCQFTFFGSVFPLFLSQLGLSKSQMGFLFSLMPFCGLLAPFLAPAAARFGYKNFYLAFWGTRKVFTAFLLLTPWVLGMFGVQGALVLVSIITAILPSAGRRPRRRACPGCRSMCRVRRKANTRPPTIFSPRWPAFLR